MLTITDLFRRCDEYLVAHPEWERAMRQVGWVEWAERQMHPVRLVERRYREGELVSERDVTLAHPEPEI